MKPNVWMPLYVGDYLRDTLYLSFEDHGRYLSLMMAYWSKGGPLLEEEVKGIMRDASLTHCVRIASFFQIAGGIWRHKRIDAELERAKANSDSRTRAATSAANARWDSKKRDEKKLCVTHASRMPHEVPSPSPSPSHKEVQTPLPPFTVDPIQAFEIFWNEYPRKIKRGDAEHAFAEVNASVVIREVVSAIQHQKQSEDWQKDSGKFIPYPANWLRDKQWLDQVNGNETKPEEFCTKSSTRFRVISRKGYIYWTRQDGGPKREQWGKGPDQEVSFQATRQAYESWLKL